MWEEFGKNNDKRLKKTDELWKFVNIEAICRNNRSMDLTKTVDTGRMERQLCFSTILTSK